MNSKPETHEAPGILPQKLNRQGTSLLASAIVRQAVRDWQEGDDQMRTDCEMFFGSGWYQELREMAPDAIPVNMMRRLTR